MTTQNSLILLFISLLVTVQTAISQNCRETGCPGIRECCSLYGFCGTTNKHCGFWCDGGPCTLKYKSGGKNFGLNVGPRATVESVVTPALFANITKISGSSNCPAKGFYTHEAFISAVTSFGAYKGTVPKAEIAALLAQFSYASKGFCYKEETKKEKFCSPSRSYPCEPGKKYYGRGPLPSVKWNEYYGTAGKFLGLPLLKDPDMVARDPVVAFKYAMWFWNRNVRPALRLGFGATTKRIDFRECHVEPEEMKNRVNQYLEICKMIGVSPNEDNFAC